MRNYTRELVEPGALQVGEDRFAIGEHGEMLAIFSDGVRYKWDAETQTWREERK